MRRSPAKALVDADVQNVLKACFFSCHIQSIATYAQKVKICVTEVVYGIKSRRLPMSYRRWCAPNGDVSTVLRTYSARR